MFWKYHDGILDKTTNPIQEPARFESGEQTLQVERGLREQEKVLATGLGGECKYLVPGMRHDVELLSWVHILQMWMLQMPSMLSARYTTDQNQQPGECHCPNETHSIVKLNGESLLRLNLWSFWPKKWFVCQQSTHFIFKMPIKDFRTQLAYLPTVISSVKCKM